MDTSTVVAMDALQGPPPLQHPLLLSKDAPSYGPTAPPLGIELSGGDTSGLTQVTNTTIDPYKWICLLEIAWPDGKSTIGTAFFQHQGGGVPIAVTCAHCLYNYDHGGWAEQINLYQARNGSTQPYSVATFKGNSSLRVSDQWLADKDAADYDYGCLVFSGTSFGFGWVYSNDSGLYYNNPDYCAGYPASAPTYGTMWETQGKTLTWTGVRLDLSMAFDSGMSGSPVWVNYDGTNRVIGIGQGTDTSTGNTTAVCYRGDLMDDLKAWAGAT